MGHIGKKAIRNLYKTSIGSGYSTEEETEVGAGVITSSNTSGTNNPIGSLPLEKEYAFMEARFEVFDPEELIVLISL